MSRFLAHANTDIKDETTGFVLLDPPWRGARTEAAAHSPAAEHQRGNVAANPFTNCYTAKDKEIQNCPNQDASLISQNSLEAPSLSFYQGEFGLQ